MTVEQSNGKGNSEVRNKRLCEDCSSYKLGVFQLEEKKENPGCTDHDNKSEVRGWEKNKVVSI